MAAQFERATSGSRSSCRNSFRPSRAYAEAYGKDPEFHRFVRSLQSYELFPGKRSTLLLSADSPLFLYLSGPRPAGGETLTPIAPFSPVAAVVGARE